MKPLYHQVKVVELITPVTFYSMYNITCPIAQSVSRKLCTEINIAKLMSLYDTEIPNY